MNTLLGQLDQIAIERLQEFEHAVKQGKFYLVVDEWDDYGKDSFARLVLELTENRR